LIKYIRAELYNCTNKEIEAEVGAALAAPPSADSAAKGYFKFGRSCRLNKE